MNKDKVITSTQYVDKLDPWSSHSIIAGWIRKLPANSIVLDIGTATGTLARICSKTSLHWRGVEPNEELGQIARSAYNEFFIGKIDQVPDDFIAQADFIILADVLEHLTDPTKTLERIVKLQKPGCGFGISVPNIANFYIRLNLLMGKFNYTDRGILDKTHLRFFTRKSFEFLIRQSALEIIRRRTTPIPLNLVNAFFLKYRVGRFFHKTLAFGSNHWPTMLGYQFVYLCRLPANEEKSP